MNTLRADQTPAHGDDDFQVRRIRPGAIGGSEVDTALGPLAAFDHAKLSPGKVVKIHEHKNDEILSYIWRGTMVHEDSAGKRILLLPSKLMMSGGESFWHEESVPDGFVEMLQIFVRPRQADLPAAVSFHDRPDGVPVDDWGWIAGPEESGAPLIIRNEIHVYDAHLLEGQQIELPSRTGLTPVLYVMDGTIRISDEVLRSGDAVSDDVIPTLTAVSEASLVLFLIDVTASGSRAGTISGQ